ncbi:hypothetical protein J23TS9_05530 [Paenibacillus sp. J23TS9]|uniref:hypothetical protein n=1 Tax=Paenibacillus sp. J23TS9 TaxID=2807193 RepID=UPI001B0DA4B8|nr:hypothetical protein [Paenibacillus sp. J23TS9]GIP25423.1 hypothetical protein J23TS9_05530 [Paenibacillus sp. J23TS9]
MLEKIEQYKERISGISKDIEQAPEVKALLDEMLEDLSTTIQQNYALRRTILKSTNKGSRMSTKLKDALYE